MCLTGWGHSEAMSRPLARGVPSVSYSASMAASLMKSSQVFQSGFLPAPNFFWYWVRLSTTPPYSRLYSTGRPFSLPPQVAPASGAAKKVFCASLSVTMSFGTSASWSAKVQTQEGCTRTMSYGRVPALRSASRVWARLV